jgi:hypothetical protein
MVAGEYARLEGKPLPFEFTTYSAEIENLARRIHDELKWLITLDQSLAKSYEASILNFYDGLYLKLWSENSGPFNSWTRNRRTVDPNLAEGVYKPMLSSDAVTYFGTPEAAQDTVDKLNLSLHDLPVTPYDVKKWFWVESSLYKDAGVPIGDVSAGFVIRAGEFLPDVEGVVPPEGAVALYSGHMVFRGALTVGNDPVFAPDTASPQAAHQAHVGDVVTNTDFLSTAASPEVAAEFVVRQAVADLKNPQLKVYDDIERDKRVLFRIEHRTGKNITRWTALVQAEILFPQYTCFKVVAVERDVYFGLLVELVELSEQERAGITTARNIATGEAVTLSPAG